LQDRLCCCAPVLEYQFIAYLENPWERTSAVTHGLAAQMQVEVWPPSLQKDPADVTSTSSRNLHSISGASSVCGRAIVDGRALRERRGESQAQRVAIREKERSVAVPVWAKVSTEGSRQHSPFASTLCRREICAVYIKRIALIRV
jgi:hypothetical protein